MHIDAGQVIAATGVTNPADVAAIIERMECDSTLAAPHAVTAEAFAESALEAWAIVVLVRTRACPSHAGRSC